MHSKIDVSVDECDLKFAKDDSRTFEGYLSVFGNVDSYGDTVIKGAFAETLKGRKRMPPMLLNHDSFGNLPVGVWKSMTEDDRGLLVKGEMTPGNSLAQDVYASMKHGAISGLSIGYKSIDYSENDHGGRDLKKVHLFEGSIVTMPAEDDARISAVKAMVDEIETVSDCEHFLRDVGMSRKSAKQFLAKLKDVHLRDAGDLEAEIAELKERLGRYELHQARVSRLDNIQRLIGG